MHIGIIGTGHMGSALGKRWADSGHQIFFGSRDPAAAKSMADIMGPNLQAGSIANAAEFGEAVLLAVPWSAVTDTLEEMGDLNGQLIIDCTNPFKAGSFDVAPGTATSAAEYISQKVPEAQVVKAFNTVFAINIMKSEEFKIKPAMFYCGDVDASKELVNQLGTDIGFDPVDCGSLAQARYLESLASLLVKLGYDQEMGTEIAFNILHRN